MDRKLKGNGTLV